MSENIFTNVLPDLEGGVFPAKIDQALKDVALGVISHDKAGSVTIKLDLSKIKGTHQVRMKHKVSYSQPTLNGKKTEENTTDTPLFVGQNGSLTITPENQMDWLKDTQEA